ncbi:MAG: DMT family transporter [Oscillospiraceae bacterium]|nr:DMT family transporter [Oscillospiraceae bacterium]
MKNRSAMINLIVSMLIFGTIGIFRNYIPLPSSVVALIRGAVGTVFLAGLCLVRQKLPDWRSIRKNLALLLVSGAFIGFNWILLFEAYRYTTVATATLCYYLAPVFVILVSPLLFKERLGLWKLMCVALALGGMVFVTGAADGGLPGPEELRGIVLGVGAAVLYACVVLMNKKLTGVQAFDRTIVQLGAAAVSLVPYVLLTEWGKPMNWSGPVVGLLLVVGVVHTGIAYALYFGSIKELPAQTSALFSYIDPVSAILLSAVFLPNEVLTPTGILGAVLVLGATLLSELPVGRKK